MYCWVIIMAAGLSRGGRSDSIVLNFGLQLHYVVYIHICIYAIQFRLPQSSSCARPSGTHGLYKLDSACRLHSMSSASNLLLERRLIR